MAQWPIWPYRRGCECHACNGLKCGLETAPTAYLVDRDGLVLRICTRCLLESDQVVEILADENAPYQLYSQYDQDGAARLIAKMMMRARSTGDFSMESTSSWPTVSSR